MKKLIIGVVLLLLVILGIGYYTTDGEFLQGRFFTRINLNVSTASDTPNADILVIGSEYVEVAKFKFESSDIKTELDISDMTFSIDPSVENNIGQLTVEYEDEDGLMQTDDGYFAGGTAEVPGMDFYLAANSSAYATVYVEINDIYSATPGEKFAITLDSFEGINLVTMNSLIKPVGARGNIMHVYETKPTFALSSSSPSGAQTVSSNDDVFGFTVTADDGGSLTLRTLTINAMSDGDFDTNSRTSAYLVKDGTTYATGNISFSDSSNAKFEFDEMDVELTVSAGDTETLWLELNTGDLLDDDSGIDNTVTFSIEYGTARNAGGITWYDTNEEVTWVGDTSSTSLRSNTLIY